MKKADIILAIVTGLGVAFLLGGMVRDAGVETIFGLSIEFLNNSFFIVFPIAAAVALQIADFLGKKFPFMPQLVKFLYIGALATIIDVWIFKGVKMVFSSDTEQIRVISKAISFIGATIIKYWANKFLAFGKEEMKDAKKEFIQFFIVTLISLGINLYTFNWLVNIMGPQFNIPQNIWETISVIGAGILTAVWNFLGYKFIVFKK